MSGRPAREPRFDPYGRPQSSGRTERPRPSTAQPTQQHPTIQEPYQPQSPEYWDDEYGYEDQYDYQQYEPAPEPVARQRQEPGRRQPQIQQDYDEDLYEDPFVPNDEDRPRRRPQQQRPRRSSQSRRQQRRSPGFVMPAVIGNAPIAKDKTAVSMLAVGVVSLLAMIVVVAVRRSGVEPAFFTEVNANGDPTNLQNASAIWRLPLMAGMVTLISTVAAWFLARWDTFLSKFLLGGMLAVHFIIWVAVIARLF